MPVTVLELRQYTLRPDQRDVLIDLFDREFLESQEALGMDVVGQFRDLDDPDRFVWLRSFPDMPARAAALTAFYLDGAVWKEHGPAANATMLDSDDVLLLRPAGTAATGTAPVARSRPPVGTAGVPDSRFLATVYPLRGPVDDEFVAFLAREVTPLIVQSGAEPVASLETEPAENTFPRLPVRTGENVFVSLFRFADDARLAMHLQRLAGDERWNAAVRPALMDRLAAAPQQLTLAPTARSKLR